MQPRRKYPSSNVSLDAGKMSGVMQMGGSVDRTAGAGSYSHGSAGGTVRVPDYRAEGAHVPAEILRREDVQVVRWTGNEGFSGSERRSDVEGLRVELNEGAASR